MERRASSLVRVTVQLPNRLGELTIGIDPNLVRFFEQCDPDGSYHVYAGQTPVEWLKRRIEEFVAVALREPHPSPREERNALARAADRACCSSAPAFFLMQELPWERYVSDELQAEALRFLREDRVGLARIVTGTSRLGIQNSLRSGY